MFSPTHPQLTLLLLLLLLPSTLPFLVPPPALLHSPSSYRPLLLSPQLSTSLNSAGSIFFGGTPTGSPASSPSKATDESCELVAVNIERLSMNSRRISGEITVDRPADDVWAILTDYDNLSTHVPNLVESSTVPGFSSPGKRRLYQKGAQKIAGFEFGASVTMDMTENSRVGSKSIAFKCVTSPFFSLFDGTWTVTILNDRETRVDYVVDVKPKGLVPVIPLEWRIREDVPTNLRSVKYAAENVGREGVEKERVLRRGGEIGGGGDGEGVGGGEGRWGKGETMAKYL